MLVVAELADDAEQLIEESHDTLVGGTLTSITRQERFQGFTRHHSSLHRSRDIWSEGLSPDCTTKPSEKLAPNAFSASPSR